MKRSSIQRTTKSLLNMRDRIRFDLPFRHNSVWKNDRRSYLGRFCHQGSLYPEYFRLVMEMGTSGLLMGNSVECRGTRT